MAGRPLTVMIDHWHLSHTLNHSLSSSPARHHTDHHTDGAVQTPHRRSSPDTTQMEQSDTGHHTDGAVQTPHRRSSPDTTQPEQSRHHTDGAVPTPHRWSSPVGLRATLPSPWHDHRTLNPLTSHSWYNYRITGKFGGSFNLAIWRIWPLITKLKISSGRNVSAVVITPETPN